MGKKLIVGDFIPKQGDLQGDLRVWWIPQIPGKPFHVYIPNGDIEKAKLILATLARYDDFQLKNNIKPDYSNAGGLEVSTKEFEWEEWHNEEDEDINEVMRNEEVV